MMHAACFAMAPASSAEAAHANNRLHKVLACCRDSERMVLLRSQLVSCSALPVAAWHPNETKMMLATACAVLLVTICLCAGQISHTRGTRYDKGALSC